MAATLTEVELVSDPLDWPGQGNSYLFTPDEQIIKAWGDASTVTLLSRQRGVFVGWGATFAAPAGETLVPGTYTGATRYPSANGGPAMTVEAGYVCNTSVGDFTVRELSFDQFGDVEALDVTFEQHCNGDAGSGLRGSWRFQASDTAARDFTRLPEPTEPPLGQPAQPSRPPTVWLIPPRRPGLPQAPSGRTSLDIRDEAALLASRRRFCRSRYFARQWISAGSAAGERIVGSRQPDLIFGRAGNDRLLGRRGSDCVHGGPGRDMLGGATGRDVLLGGSGADTLVGGPGRDRLDCGPGRDSAHASRRDVIRRCEGIIYRRR